MAIETRQRKTRQYVNDSAGYTKAETEALFGFTLKELYALESWVPRSDGFHKEIVEAIDELEKQQPDSETTRTGRGDDDGTNNKGNRNRL